MWQLCSSFVGLFAPLPLLLGMYLLGLKVEPSSWWNLPIGALALVATLVMHECAHYAVGRLVGIRVALIEIGRGPKWRWFRIGRTSVFMFGAPSESSTLWWSPKRTGLRWRLALTYLAGPMMTAGVWLVSVKANETSFGDVLPGEQLVSGPVLWANLVWANALTLLVSLSPFNVLRKRAPYSDIDKVIAYARMDDVDLNDLSQSGLIIAINHATEQKAFGMAAALVDDALRAAPNDQFLKYARGVVAECANDRGLAERCFRQVLASDAPPQLRAEVQCLLAGVLFQQQNEAQRDEAATLIAQALAALPDKRHARRTHGAILGWQGQSSAALDLLLPTFAEATRADERADIAAYVAMNYAALGDHTAAAKWLADAAALDHLCNLLPLARAHVAAARLPFPNGV